MKTTGLLHRHYLSAHDPNVRAHVAPIHAPHLKALLIVRDPQDQKPLNRLTAVAGSRTFAISADEVDHRPGESDPGTGFGLHPSFNLIDRHALDRLTVQLSQIPKEPGSDRGSLAIPTGLSRGR